MSKKIEYILIKNKNDFCNTEEELKSLFKTNSRIEFKEDKIVIDNKEFLYSIYVKNVEVKKKKEVLFKVEFACEEEREQDAIENLEKLNDIVRRIIEVYGSVFTINTIWDDVSIYYGKLLYPFISQIENLMRKIIYTFMIGNFGIEWVDKNIPKNVKEAIKGVQEKNNCSNFAEDCLYSADFIQLGYFLFGSYCKEKDVQKLLKKLQENELKEEDKKSIIEDYESKSNWDRYFSEKIHIDNLQGKWNKLYLYRNMVAHNKPIDNEDYKEALAIIHELINAFEECIYNLNEINLTDDAKVAVGKFAEESIEEHVSEVCLEEEIKNPRWEIPISQTTMERLSMLKVLEVPTLKVPEVPISQTTMERLSMLKVPEVPTLKVPEVPTTLTAKMQQFKIPEVPLQRTTEASTIVKKSLRNE